MLCATIFVQFWLKKVHRPKRIKVLWYMYVKYVVMSLYDIHKHNTIIMIVYISSWYFKCCILLHKAIVCFTHFVLFCAFRGASLGGTVDVLCYRDYTREGKRINTHSLIIQGVKLPPKTEGQRAPVGTKTNLAISAFAGSCLPRNVTVLQDRGEGASRLLPHAHSPPPPPPPKIPSNFCFNLHTL